MNNNLPNGITGEKDLELYEMYLKNDLKDYSTNYKNCLEKHKGKFVKVESFISGRIYSRSGVLLEVGSEYIIIRPDKNCISTLINLKDVKYITVIHNKRKT